MGGRFGLRILFLFFCLYVLKAMAGCSAVLEIAKAN